MLGDKQKPETEKQMHQKEYGQTVTPWTLSFCHPMVLQHTHTFSWQ